MMDTYWLIEKVGGLPRSLEIDQPGFMDVEPEYFRTLVDD